MKNSKEMADSVFKIRDEYLEKQRKRKRKLKKAAYIGSSVCMFGLILVGIHFTVPNKHQIPTITVPESTNHSDVSEIETEDTHKVDETLQADSTSNELETQDNSGELIETENHSETKNSQTQIEALQAIESEPAQEENVPPSDSNIGETVPPPPDQEETIQPPDKSNPDTDGVEESIVSYPDSFDMWTLNDIYNSFPEISFEKQYRCLNIAITEDMLELAIADITVTGSNCHTAENISTDVVVYSFVDSAEHDEIAIWFKGRNDYIVYRAEEME